MLIMDTHELQRFPVNQTKSIFFRTNTYFDLNEPLLPETHTHTLSHSMFGHYLHSRQNNIKSLLTWIIWPDQLDQ